MNMRKGMMWLCLLTATVHAGDKHLFILSGQSNMARMNPELFWLRTLDVEDTPTPFPLECQCLHRLVSSWRT